MVMMSTARSFEMLEVIVTCLITDLDPAELSGSIAERGQNAGQETWDNSMQAAKDHAPILKPNERPAARKFFRSFGAWDDEQVAAWTDQELDALVLQYAAGDLRELQWVAPGDGLGDIDWNEAEKLSHEGIVSGSLFVSGDNLYVSLSN
jgi:hypothetical protein